MDAYLRRYIEKAVTDDLKRKMVFVGGPRQSGKTTMAKRLCQEAGFDTRKRYLNWDAPEDRENIIRERFPAGPGYLVLDEIHKYSRWRQVVKGLYDKRGHELQILVTGSARLDYYRRGGDSLQGRYHFHRLFPVTYAELAVPSSSTVMDLLAYGGFPEPFLLQSERETKRWSRDYRSRVVRGELTDLENVQDVGIIEKMVLRMPDLVGSPLSINALREDLQVSHQSVARWITMLENLYMIFRIYPFGAAKIRAVKKEAKHYHLDWTVVKNTGYRFENLVACHLLKWCFFMEDTQGRDVELRYFRDVDRREVDFVIVEDGQPIHFVECRKSGKDLSRSLRYLKVRFPSVEATQVLLEKDVDLVTKEGIRICSAPLFLDQFV
ncbi:MAG: ATP-binding protein [Thermodesulfobacteriota bacterium]|nr:ATP-binding protein [Thermodesulfobacteriota bacterium]